MSFTPENEPESTPTKVAVGQPRWYVVQVGSRLRKKS